MKKTIKKTIAIISISISIIVILLICSLLPVFHKGKPLILEGGFINSITDTENNEEAIVKLKNVTLNDNELYALEISQNISDDGNVSVKKTDIPLSLKNQIARQVKIPLSINKDTTLRKTWIIFQDDYEANEWKAHFESKVFSISNLGEPLGKKSIEELYNPEYQFSSVEFTILNPKLSRAYFKDPRIKELQQERNKEYEKEIQKEKEAEEKRKKEEEEKKQKRDEEKRKKEEERQKIQAAAKTAHIEKTYSDNDITKYTVEVPAGETIRINGNTEGLLIIYLRTIGDEYLDSKSISGGDFEVFFNHNSSNVKGMYHIELKHPYPVNWTIDII